MGWICDTLIEILGGVTKEHYDCTRQIDETMATKLRNDALSEQNNQHEEDLAKLKRDSEDKLASNWRQYEERIASIKRDLESESKLAKYNLETQLQAIIAEVEKERDEWKMIALERRIAADRILVNLDAFRETEKKIQGRSANLLERNKVYQPMDSGDLELAFKAIAKECR